MVGTTTLVHWSLKYVCGHCPGEHLCLSDRMQRFAHVRRPIGGAGEELCQNFEFVRRFSAALQVVYAYNSDLFIFLW